MRREGAFSARRKQKVSLVFRLVLLAATLVSAAFAAEAKTGRKILDTIIDEPC